MKEVKLLKLELNNYRNIEHEIFVFNGSNAKIVGENRIGKTNTLEAIYFLLSNYLLDGGSELANIKPLNDTKKEVKVEGTFEVDGREIRLGKTYGEKWVKQRGTDEISMQGHYEEYFVNGIKQSKERDYHNLLKEYFGVRNDEKGEIDEIQMLINPLYLGNLGDSKDWQRLRTFIVKLIGDVSDEEVFAKAPETKIIEQDLLNALGKTDQLKKMYANDIDTLTNQIAGYDSKIELVENTENPSDKEVEEAKAKIDDLNAKIVETKSGATTDSVAKQLEQEIFNLDKEIVEKNGVEFKAYMQENTASKEKVERDNKVKELNEKVNEWVNKLTDLNIKIGGIESQINYQNTTRNELVAKLKDIEQKIRNVDTMVVVECPTCHRPFEPKDIEERKQKLIDSLNTERQQIIEKGSANTKLLKANEEALAKLKDERDSLKGDIENIRAKLDELNAMTFERPTFKESAELVALREKQKELKEQLTARKEQANDIALQNYEEAMKLEQERNEAQKVLEDRNFYERQMKILEGLKLEEKGVASSLTMTEQKAVALKTYLYTKLRLLDEHIAKVFGKLRFQLIKENINGGFDPVCKPYIYDIDKDESSNVLWKSGSKSEKIITGITIVEAIRKELDLTELPYLFDEGGEISNETLRNKFKTNAQIICVRVEDNIQKPIVVKF